MIAVDANILVRAADAGRSHQFATAQRLVDETDLFVSVLVVPETAWVLRDSYRFKARAVTSGLRDLFGLPTVHVETAELVDRALDWTDRGLDIADALILAGATHFAALVTFDRAFVRRAAALGAVPVRLP